MTFKPDPKEEEFYARLGSTNAFPTDMLRYDDSTIIADEGKGVDRRVTVQATRPCGRKYAHTIARYASFSWIPA